MSGPDSSDASRQASVAVSPFAIAVRLSGMHYALLIYERPANYEGLSDDERTAMTAEYMAVGEQSVGSAHLQPTSMATTVRVADGETLVTDGPFADTKDVFGGYYVIEADDLDSAIALAAQVPAARFGGCVEIRPVRGFLR